MLHLDPAAPVNDAVFGDAVALFTRGFAVGRNMADLDVSAAYHLETQDALAGGTMTLTLMGSEAGSGRDWTDTPPSSRTWSRSAPGRARPAPWTGKDAAGKDKPVPYLVAATLDALDSDYVWLNFGARRTGCRSASSSSCWPPTPICGATT
ncbi:hypothetical protein NKH77_28900 [Streptomyces sp. M19]